LLESRVCAVAEDGNHNRVSRFKRMTHAAVYGPRGDLARKVERPLARRTPLSRESVRSLFGALFLFWSARRVVRALRAGFRR
jgi:hypothetical protein